MAAAGFGTRVELRLADDGPGLPGASIPKLFEPFYSGRNKGNGLGLYHAKRICDAMGVGLFAEAHLPHGLSFRFVFPVSVEKPEARLEQAILKEEIL